MRNSTLEKARNINSVIFLPEVASATVEIPRRSAIGRDAPGMLTGSERTGWILQWKPEQVTESEGLHAKKQTAKAWSTKRQAPGFRPVSNLHSFVLTIERVLDCSKQS